MTIKRKAAAPVIAIIFLLALTMTAAFGSNVFRDTKKGSILPVAHAIEESLTKEVGDIVNFRVKIKNTGNTMTAYIITVYWREHGTNEWERACIEDIVLEPEQYEHIEVGLLECNLDMAGKYFDVKFLLYEHESEQLLDSVEIENAWYVSETIVSGSIIGHWVY